MSFAKLCTALIALVCSVFATSTEAAPQRKPTPMTYSSCTLAGNRVSNMYSLYLGYTGVLPQTLSIDFRERLGALWDMKLRKAGRNPVVRQMRAELIAAYNPKQATHMRLHEYIARASSEIARTRAALNWNAVGTMYFKGPNGVNARKLALLQKVSTLVSGRDLIAYGLTELMPSGDGVLNREVLDCLLRNAGRQFVESIPAVYDVKTSFGLFQFTEFAIYDVGREQRGASRMNRALPAKMRIPGSVIFIHGDLHFRAAYLFGLHNLALLIRALNEKELRVLERVWKRSDESVLQYIAAAHHLPAYAIGAGRRWLANGARSPFYVSTSGALRTYARNTTRNYRALH